jgi:hypothetical protein
VIDWEKAQEIAKLLEVVTPKARRGALAVLLKAEGCRLPRAVPSSQLYDLHKLAEFMRLYAVEIK